MKFRNKLLPIITITASVLTPTLVLTNCSKKSKDGIDPTQPYTPSIGQHGGTSYSSVDAGLNEYINSIAQNIEIFKQDIYWSDSMSWAKSEKVESSCWIVVNSISIDETSKTFNVNYSSSSTYRFEPTAELKITQYSFSENIQLFNMPLIASYVESPFESITQKLWCFSGTSTQSSWNDNTKIIGSENMKVIKEDGSTLSEYQINDKEVLKTTDIEKDLAAAEIVTMGDFTTYSYYFQKVTLA